MWQTGEWRMPQYRVNMGKGCHAAILNRSVARQPTDPLPFSVNQLRRAIPQHCFERSTLRSSAFVACDVTTAMLFYRASTSFDSLPPAARIVLWPLYWICQVHPLGQLRHKHCDLCQCGGTTYLLSPGCDVRTRCDLSVRAACAGHCWD